MTATLAVIRPDDWNFPLFVHVLGAMALVGALLVVATALLAAWRREGDEAAALTRFGLRSLLIWVVPSYAVMRFGAQWVEIRAGLDEVEDDPTWIGIGYITAELGLILIVLSMILAAVGLRRPSSRVPGRVVGVIAALLVVAYVVAVWAMSAKP